MEERRVSISTPAGAMELFIVHPSRPGRFPPVVFYMDMWGVRECLRDLARRVACVGYYCVLPDFYYRCGRIRYAEGEIEGDKLSFESLDPEHQSALRAAMAGLSDAMVLEDTRTLLAFMADGEPASPGPVGAIGYCMGGRHALCAAGSFPDRFRAAACIHGTDLIRDGPDSPHIRAKSARGEIYGGHAGLDKYAPPNVVGEMERALSGCGVKYSYKLHHGAQHAYAIPNRDVYDKHAANEDWEAIYGMFRRQLPWDNRSM